VSAGKYTVEVQHEDPFPPAAAIPAKVSVAFAAPSVAAYWDAGQHLDGTLSIANTGSASADLALDAVTSDQRWTVSLSQDHVTVAAGATATVPLTVNVPSDAWADAPVRISVRGADSSGAQATGFANVTPGRDAAPVSPYQAWSVPDALLGGLDVASTALGGAPVLQYDPTMETQMYDGYTPSGGGFYGTVTLPATFTTDLAGDAELPIAGMIVNPQARNADLNSAPKDVELLLSDDGSTWTSALKGTMTPLGVDQAFVLPAPVNAKFARLQVDSTYGDGTSVAIGEFKVVATPGTPIPPPAGSAGGPLDVADPALGGHIVTIDPLTGSSDIAATILDSNLNSAGVVAHGGVRPTWVIGFWNDRAAQLSGLGWKDPNGSDPTRRFTQVHVETSLDSPLGPWTDQGTWKLKRAPDGSVANLTFAQPVWARYVQFTADAAKQDLFRELPGMLSAFEVPTDATNRSIMGEYGPTQAGPYEVANPPALTAPDYAPDGNDTPDAATPLAQGQTVTSTVHTGQDVDWYDVVAPAGQNTLTFTLQGTPRVGTSLVLQDDSGASVPMTFAHGQDPGSATYTAAVTPGQHYRVEVQQPPFSVVFTFDTSGSMGNYLPFVYEAIHSFSDSIDPGRQAVKIMPFEQPSLLPDWTDDKYALQDSLEGIRVGGGSSAAETSLLNATDELSSREGATAIVTVTDADTTSWDHSGALWQALAKVRPLVFSIHVAADAVIAPATALMQDWAYSSGGFYQYTRSHGEMDRAFDRMATWLERPTQYELAWTSSFKKPPAGNGPQGSLAILGPQLTNGSNAVVPAGSGVAVEVILDTSGSMLTPISGTTRRIDAAKSVLDELLRNGLPRGSPVALRILGDQAQPCGTRAVVPLGPLDPVAMTKLVDGINIVQAADTPIAAAINAVPADLASVNGTKILILITDSQEIWPNKDLCGKDPAVAIRALGKKGIDASVNIVGLNVTDKKARQNLSRWATIGKGVYYAANGAQELSTAVESALRAPFKVFDQQNNLVAGGVVGGPPVPLPPGTYHVTVLTDPQIELDGVVVAAGTPLVITLPTSQ
jgi:Mg-chelatase subunit ChlD